MESEADFCRRQNVAENAFESRAIRNGWVVTKRGWPDFICELPDGRVIAVEVKPTGPDGKPGMLKESQVKVMEWLTECGIRCFVSDGRVLVPFDPDCRKKLRSRSNRKRWKRPLRRGGFGSGVQVYAPFTFAM